VQTRIATSIAPAPTRVAVLRALALGDLLCAAPALRALRGAWPAAEIALVGLPWAREFAARYAAYVDRFIEFPGYPGLPEREPDLAAIPEFFAGMQRERFDLFVQLHGSGRFVNEIVALCNPAQSAGFYLPGDVCPDLRTYLRWPERGLEVHRLLGLVEHLGIPTCGDHLELPLTDDDFLALARLLPHAELTPRQYVVVHPGASSDQRRWSAERFAAVADELAERGLQIVLTGVAAEQPILAAVANGMRQRCLNLCGQTNLGTLGALVARAALVVSNDTGISHVAAATCTPSVVISTGDNPARWAPINRRLHRVLCRPGGVAVEEVCRAAEELLQTVEMAHGPELATTH
jgi:ADP-heptose:LPS heptosyltransferase